MRADVCQRTIDLSRRVATAVALIATSVACLGAPESEAPAARSVDDALYWPCELRAIEGATFHFCSSVRLAWHEALDACRLGGATLAYFDTKPQSDAVQDATWEIAQPWWSIGLNDRDVEGQYVWADGEAPGFENRSPGGPVLHGASDCGAFAPALYGWTEANCSQSAAFVCRAPSP